MAITSYTVRKGDTLREIVYGYNKTNGKNLTVAQVASWNNIKNPNYIVVGQVIKFFSTTTASSTTTVSSSNKPIITHFGLQANTDNVLFAKWSWTKPNTDYYRVQWLYDVGDGIEWIGSDTQEKQRQCTYTIPSNAVKVRFRLCANATQHKVNGNCEVPYWIGTWSDTKGYSVSSNPPDVPPTPSVTVENYTLTAALDNLKLGTALAVNFQLCVDDKTLSTSGSSTIVNGHASYAFAISAGKQYKVRARSQKMGQYSEWSDYSTNYKAIPNPVGGFTEVKASTETSIYFAWEKSSTAETYEIEYATNKDYFDKSDQVQKITGIETTHYDKSGLETGSEYFFRIRAVNDSGSSAWSDISSVILGSSPSAPTTWSSTTTSVIGEDLKLYWVHNGEDGSSQTYAELELDFNGNVTTETVVNSTDEKEKDKTSVYSINTSSYSEGAELKWRVRTAGVLKDDSGNPVYGDWSVQRVVIIYATPVLTLGAFDVNDNPVEVMSSFPLLIKGSTGPATQKPVSYYLSIIANQTYETVDQIGNEKIVSVGDEVYSKAFDTDEDLEITLSANDVTLENNMEYTMKCIVSMDSGLTAESSFIFSVQWVDHSPDINLEVNVDTKSYTASIHPYCESYNAVYYLVTENDGVFTETSQTIDPIEDGEPYLGEVVSENETPFTYTTNDNTVYIGNQSNGTSVYFTILSNPTLTENTSLSVYRREFDGGYVEIASGIDNNSNTYVTDPHPALDYARYRIVAKSMNTGLISYYDAPGYPVEGKAVIIQWDEKWSSYDNPELTDLEQPSWSGSMLKLPYNIDVSDSTKPDVTLIEYIGRSNPVSYYGTQVGFTSNWSVAVPKEDTETIYALRRLSKWMGDVYVREPSGTGYWANITVSFSQTHCDPVVPVTLSIARVVGGA